MACYSVALLLVSSSVFISSAVIQCFIKPRGPDAGRGPGGLGAPGASHSAPGAVRIVALWEPATVACYSVALLLVSSGVFISSAVVQCSIQPRGPDAGRGPGGLDALGASHSAPGAVRVVALWELATGGSPLRPGNRASRGSKRVYVCFLFVSGFCEVHALSFTSPSGGRCGL